MESDGPKFWWVLRDDVLVVLPVEFEGSVYVWGATTVGEEPG